MKKVLFYNSLYCTGGTEIATLNLIRQLKNDYSIYVGYSDHNSDMELLKKFEEYAKVICMNEIISIFFDIIVFCTIHDKEALNIIKGSKKVLWVHGLYSLKRSVFMDLSFSNKFDQVVIVSKSSEIKLINSFPYLKDKIKTIYNVIDKSEIIEKSKLPIKLDLSDELNLVTVARISKEKGFYRMLELADCLKKRNINFKWFVIGYNYYNEKADEIIKLYEKYGTNFEFFGFICNPHNIVKQCDYSVLLSDDETWGLVLTEAMVLGVPCITTDFEAAFEQIEDKKNGIILSRTELESYKDRIDEILSNKDNYKKSVKKFEYNNLQILKDWKKILG